MNKTYMTYAQCVEYLQTTIFDDEINMKINVFHVGETDNEGLFIEEKYAVTILLTDDKQYRKLILLKKVRDKSPYYFRSLDKIFNELLWKRDACLCMIGSLPPNYFNDHYFYSKTF